MSFEDLVRDRVAAGLVPEAATDPEAYVARRLDLHRTGDPALTVRLSDGRWILVHDHRLPGGGTVTAFQDITELKRVEQAYRESEHRFHDFVDASRSEEHTSELQSLMRSSYAVFCLKKKITISNT